MYIMNYEISGTISKIIFTNKNKDNTYFIIITIEYNNKKYKIDGNVKFIPTIGDYIIVNGNCTENNNYNEICLNKCNIIIDLPNQHKFIYERLCNIYNDQINKILSEKTINELSNIKNIWNLLDNKKLNNKIQLDSNLYDYLYATYDKYINNRFNCEFQRLDNFCRHNSIKLKSNQINNLLKKYLLAQTIINIINDKDDDYTILKLLDIETIGMKTLLNICNALNMNYNKKINICIINALLNNSEGHSCLKISELQTIIFNELKNKDYKLEYKNFDDNLTNLQKRNYIYIYNNYIYAKQYYKAETKISKFLVTLSKSKSILSKYESGATKYILNDDYIIDKEINADNPDLNNYPLNEQQKEACIQIFKNNFCIISGKAGTGKSSGIMIPLLFLKRHYTNIDILCLSPTGKACIRLNNEFKKPEYNLNHKAYTIHKFNYYNGPYYKDHNETELDDAKNIDIFDTFLNNSNNIKLIIIDEFSMVDLETFYFFIKKIKHLPNICLLLVGDHNQLPSVSVGDLLNRLIKSYVFPIIKLTEVVRADGGIVTMSNNVLECLPLFTNIQKDNNLVNWIQLNPDDDNNKNIILDNIKSVDNPLILSTTNKLINSMHEEIKLILNPTLDIATCIFNIKSNADKKDIDLINNLELEILTYKQKFDENVIENDRYTIYEFISNKLKQNDLTTELKESFDSKIFLLKNVTEYLNKLDLRQIHKIIKEFKNKYCNLFTKINKIFNALNKYEKDKYYNYLFNLFNNDFNDSIEIYNYKYKLYDKIMITKNINDSLMNGMIGKIIKFDNYEKKLYVNFSDTETDNDIKHNEFEHIQLAFVITIHKSQGSESDNVIILINDSRLNTINLLYTAITRSKQTCTIIATYEVIKSIIENKKFVKRNSNIHKFCQEYYS